MILSSEKKEQSENVYKKILFIENQMIKNNIRYTMYDLMQETRKFLDITIPVRKYPNTNTNQNIY